LFAAEGPWDHPGMCAGRRRVVALLVSALVLAACGGGSASNSDDTSPDNGATPSPTQSVPDDLQVPKEVPQRATGPAKRSSTRVIRRWLAALDRGDVDRAARYFALPSKFQNTGTPVLHIDSEEERIAVNLSLTCGARAEKTAGAGPYTIVLFRLVERTGPGGGCGSGVGATVRGAILVSGGLIREWYRLPDDPSQAQQDEPSGPSA
jgi:hypothetical protein